MRSKALKILNVAFTVGSQRSTIFPVEDFVRMLMFRNATEAADFIQQYGLNINDGYVLFILYYVRSFLKAIVSNVISEMQNSQK